MVGDPQANVDFYADVLGLRLVKRTIDHEDVLRHHLRDGTGAGDPGTVHTCVRSPANRRDAGGRRS
jgi:glyoxalase family protein